MNIATIIIGGLFFLLLSAPIWVPGMLIWGTFVTQ